MDAAGVGWTCGSFANNERFATAAAQTFTTACNQIGMGVSFTYPGNAKNAMIEKPASSQHLERAMLVAMYSHGNIFGPNLEYVPAPKIMQYPWHVWGDLGVLRWVFMGGCDALGFPLPPNGNVILDTRVAAPRRWSGTMAGISGMCGYRSESWYIPGFQQLMPIMEFGEVGIMQVGSGYAQTLVNNFNALNTFWGSWVQAGAWLHGQLNHLAEAACYVNRPESLGEHLKNYLWNRQTGLTPASIHRAMVGKGAAPVYSYCERCDDQGIPTCARITAQPDLEIEGVQIFLETKEQADQELPIFGYVFDERSLRFAEAVGSANGLENFGSRISGFAGQNSATQIVGGALSTTTTPGFSVFGMSPLREEFEPLANTVTSLLAVEDGPATKSALATQKVAEQISVSASTTSIQLNGKHYPVLLDEGLQFWESYGNRSLYASIWNVTENVGVRRVPNAADLFPLVARAVGSPAPKLRLVSNEIVYVKVGNALRGQLVPARKLSIVAQTPLSKDAMVLLG